MRDIIFKNLTSADKSRRIIASQEVSEENGLRTNIYRHLLYIVKTVENTEAILPRPVLYVIKKRNTKQKKEFFYCRIRGSIYLTNQGKIHLLTYVHSLRIVLKAASKLAALS